MKECCSTVTIPLEEYQELKSEFEEKYIKIYFGAFRREEIFHKLPKDIEDALSQQEEFFNKELATVIMENNLMKWKIPRWIRKIYGAL